MTEINNRIYLFLRKQENWVDAADENGDKIIIKKEFRDYINTNFDGWNGESTNDKNDIIDRFWSKIDDITSGNVAGRKIKNLNALTEAEYSWEAMNDDFKGGAEITQWLEDNFGEGKFNYPTELTNDRDKAAWLQAVKDMATELGFEYVEKKGGIDGLVQYLSGEINSIKNQCLAEILATNIIDAIENGGNVADDIQGIIESLRKVDLPEGYSLSKDEVLLSIIKENAKNQDEILQIVLGYLQDAKITIEVNGLKPTEVTELTNYPTSGLTPLQRAVLNEEIKTELTTETDLQDGLFNTYLDENPVEGCGQGVSEDLAEAWRLGVEQELKAAAQTYFNSPEYQAKFSTLAEYFNSTIELNGVSVTLRKQIENNVTEYFTTPIEINEKQILDEYFKKYYTNDVLISLGKGVSGLNSVWNNTVFVDTTLPNSVEVEGESLPPYPEKTWGELWTDAVRNEIYMEAGIYFNKNGINSTVEGLQNHIYSIIGSIMSEVTAHYQSHLNAYEKFPDGSYVQEKENPTYNGNLVILLYPNSAELYHFGVIEGYPTSYPTQNITLSGEVAEDVKYTAGELALIDQFINELLKGGNKNYDEFGEIKDANAATIKELFEKSQTFKDYRTELEKKAEADARAKEFQDAFKNITKNSDLYKAIVEKCNANIADQVVAKIYNGEFEEIIDNIAARAADFKNVEAMCEEFVSQIEEIIAYLIRIAVENMKIKVLDNNKSWGELSSGKVKISNNTSKNHKITPDFVDEYGSIITVDPSRITYSSDCKPDSLVTIDASGNVCINGKNVSTGTYTATITVLIDGIVVGEKEIEVNIFEHLDFGKATGVNTPVEGSSIADIINNKQVLELCDSLDKALAKQRINQTIDSIAAALKEAGYDTGRIEAATKVTKAYYAAAIDAIGVITTTDKGTARDVSFTYIDEKNYSKTENSKFYLSAFDRSADRSGNGAKNLSVETTGLQISWNCSSTDYMFVNIAAILDKFQRFFNGI